MRLRSTTARALAATLSAGVLALPVLPGSPAQAANHALDGTWRMDGYGTVISVEGGRLQEYQTTAVSCVKGLTARRAGGGPGGEVRYATKGGDVARLRLVAGPDRARLHWDGSVGDRGLRRLAKLPARCATNTAPKDPPATFDAFWQTFEENYPFFAAKGVDWHAVRDRYRPRVRPDTTGPELFAIFSDMLRPLYDAHVSLADPVSRRRFSQLRPGTDPISEEVDAEAKAHTLRHELRGAPVREFAAGRITYADLPGGKGYLRVSGFGGYTGEGGDDGYAANRAELDKALDAVFTPESTARLRGLVLDLRINGGGSDALALGIAERLTDRPHFAYAKRARNHPDDPTRHTRPQRVTVRPAPGAASYTGPVAVLTGGSTFSAGETLTQALMNRPGRTIRVGEPTQGVFSDVLVRTLPNGWSLGLPNEEYLTRDGRTFDGPGIPPFPGMWAPFPEAFDRAVRELG
ncbi:S41 family peptidase [Streptomyces sp. SAJ15]|uniref:S41 family peptidase n=1 Tax=Streptomyces sp. SAJ15 TaxID=2011095 RepID=UPI0011857310|nr:S41 family peptidase [Streptomyces sp. SAJ15]TVL92641.1 protease [Streptomyces sp. SAJ15]